MKRGLKDPLPGPHDRRHNRYNRYPDEKGTESLRQGLQLRLPSPCYNRYPDEKGTERELLRWEQFFETGVTTVTPMKRGLKVVMNQQLFQAVEVCYNRYPDEKGTERISEKPLQIFRRRLQPLPR